MKSQTLSKYFFRLLLVAVAVNFVVLDYDRLAGGPKLDLLKFRGAIEEGPNFTHASGSPLSITANGDISGLHWQSHRFSGLGTVNFASGKPMGYRLSSTLKKYASDRGVPPVPQLSLDNKLLISSESLKAMPLASDGSLNVKLTGAYFVALFKLQDAKNFPASGYLSIIVN